MMSWSTAQLCTALNVTQQRISQLCKSGILPTPRDGTHDPFTAIPAYIAFLSQRLTGGDLKGARIAKYAVDTALRELELKQRSGDLVSRSAVEREFFKLARTIRDTFENVPVRVAGLVAAERDQERCHAILAGEVRQVLEGLTRGNGHEADVRPAPPPRKKEPPPRRDA